MVYKYCAWFINNEHDIIIDNEHDIYI